MRYLTSISLALVVLMALACTATPAEPTPDVPTSSGAFSCMELADKLAAAQTETAAQVFIDAWDENGCAEKAVGDQPSPNLVIQDVLVYRDVPVTVPVTRVVEVPVTRVVLETTIIMVTPELARSSSLAGTTWRFVYTHGGNQRSELVDFYDDGTFVKPLLHRDRNVWEQSGDIIHLYTDKKHSTDIGTVSGDSMSGTGSSVTGGSWTWEAFLVD